MKIKKSLLTGLAVLALFGAGVSFSVSSVNSVEANAAVHHKNSKKHKKAGKSVKKHKKAKKAVKKHKKVAKKRVKKALNKRLITKKPTIFINDGHTKNHVRYASKISKSYGNVDISPNSSENIDESHHNIQLRNIVYYKLSGNSRYKTAITLKLSYRNEDADDQYIDNERNDTYLINNDGEQLSDAWGNHVAATVPGKSHQFLNLTFYSSKRLSLNSFNTFDFDYDVSSTPYGVTINY